MNKTKIEHQINRYETVRECAEERLNELNIQLRDLCEAGKPKLRHGDFGYCDEPCYPRIVLNDGKLATVSRIIDDDEPDRPTVIFGNIFDLMKDWGKDLGELEHGYKIVPERSFKPIKIGGNWYETKEAYDIWRWIGHALMELKRKENKCS